MDGGDGNDRIENWNDNVNINGGAGNDRISNDGDGSVVDGGAGNDYISNMGDDSTILGGAGNDSIDNCNDNVSINGGAGNDKIYDDSWDATISGGAGNDTIDLVWGYKVIQYDDGDGNDVIYGFDETSTLKLGTFTHTKTKSGNDVIVTTGKKGKITLKGAAGLSAVNIVDKRTEAANNPKYILLTDKADTYTNISSGVTIDAEDGNDFIDSHSWNVSIDGGAGNDTLHGGYYGTLTGGAGKDVFVYGGLRYVAVTDYETSDKISLGSAQMSDFTVRNDNVVLGFGNNDSLTLSNAAGKKITFAEGKKSSVYIFEDDGVFNGGKTAVTLSTTGFNAESYSALVTIDGSVSEAVEIVGNAKANRIYASDNGASINGGKGNDLLWGGNGADTFFYDKGDGKDVIYGFSDNDLLAITGLTGDVVGTFNKAGTELTVKVGKTAIAVLKDFSATTFNISLNGTNHQITKSPNHQIKDSA